MKKEKYISPEAEAAIKADIKNTSRARQRAAEAAFRASQTEWAKKNVYRSLNDVYSRPSSAKLRAYEYCIRLFHELDGYDFRILSHNSMTFSVGFRYYGKNTGAACFAYITRDYDSFCFEPVA
jgi:hypothetical protein